MLRVTAGIHAGGHEYISTAHEDQKFGVPLLPAGAVQAVDVAEHLEGEKVRVGGAVGGPARIHQQEHAGRLSQQPANDLEGLRVGHFRGQ